MIFDPAAQVIQKFEKGRKMALVTSAPWVSPILLLAGVASTGLFGVTSCFAIVVTLFSDVSTGVWVDCGCVGAVLVMVYVSTFSGLPTSLWQKDTTEISLLL